MVADGFAIFRSTGTLESFSAHIPSCPPLRVTCLQVRVRRGLWSSLLPEHFRDIRTSLKGPTGYTRTTPDPKRLSFWDTEHPYQFPYQTVLTQPLEWCHYLQYLWSMCVQELTGPWWQAYNRHVTIAQRRGLKPATFWSQTQKPNQLNHTLPENLHTSHT